VADVSRLASTRVLTFGLVFAKDLGLCHRVGSSPPPGSTSANLAKQTEHTGEPQHKNVIPATSHALAGVWHAVLGGIYLKPLQYGLLQLPHLPSPCAAYKSKAPEMAMTPLSFLLLLS
jgi:hypothetical protein